MTTAGRTHGLLTHSDPPTTDPALVAEQLTGALREAAELATRKAERAPEIARHAAQRAARETARRWVVWVIVAACLVSAGMSWASLSIAMHTSAKQAAGQAAADAVNHEQQLQLDGFRIALDQANTQLLAQGKPVVPPPPPAGDATEALIALVTARVLAALPAGAARSGPQGVGIESIRPIRQGNRCVLVVRLVDPASGGITQQTAGPVADALCGIEPPKPPQATTTATTTVTPTPGTTPVRPAPAPTSTPAPAPSMTPGRATAESEPSLPALPAR